jgi:hypothetical protein
MIRNVAIALNSRLGKSPDYEKRGSAVDASKREARWQLPQEKDTIKP